MLMTKSAIFSKGKILSTFVDAIAALGIIEQKAIYNNLAIARRIHKYSS